jgi:hypothetical protein
MRQFTAAYGALTLLHRPFTSVTRVQIPSGTPSFPTTETGVLMTVDASARVTVADAGFGAGWGPKCARRGRA